MTRYEARFDLQGWYLVRWVVRLRRTLGRAEPRLLDLGMGRGRDLSWFARCGFRASGVDLDRTGIDRANRRASRLGVAIRTRVADVRTWAPRGRFEAIYSNCTLNVLPRGTRSERFRTFQQATAPGGIHAVNAFISIPRVPPPPDLDPGSTWYRPGELLRHYRGWVVIDSASVVFDCDATGTRHRHALESVVARKPGSSRTPAGAEPGHDAAEEGG